MDALNIGVYRGSGRPVKRGSERSGSDPYLYDFELSIIAHKLLRNQRSSYQQLAHFLSSTGVKPANRPLTGKDVQDMIVKATRSARAHHRQRLSLLPLLVRELACARARKDDTARRGKLGTPRLDAAQLALVLFDLAAGSRARAKGPAVVQQATASSAPDTDCYGIGHPNPDTMRLGKYAIALTPVIGPIDMLYTALNDGSMAWSVSWAIDVQPTRGGQVDTTHYGPAGHAVDAGKPLVFQIGVQMTWQPPERNVRCGPLTGLKYPEKGPMAGVPVAWDAFFSGFDKLMEHGVIVRQDAETGPDGIAMLVVRPNDEAVDAIRTGKVVTERGDLEPQVRVLGSLGSTIGVANDPLFAPSLQWSVTFHVPLRDYDFCLDRNEMPIPCPTAPPPGSS